ncbi:unnamed protein product [Microthlaspi erraticum]|uniref:HAT C-terminal dimerisation domain-containing protein n=1 Tax=Microthlaspi erraticum TaxID=1685480 RepID=A0A6D2IH01_9BRAS|nr:unnamed protein product [Microthlaspi erraticum]
MGVNFSRNSDFTLRAYSDNNYAGCLVTRRSTGSYSTYLGSNLISWSCKKQVTVAKSSTEAEYRAMLEDGSEVTWIGAPILHSMLAPNILKITFTMLGNVFLLVCLRFKSLPTTAEWELGTQICALLQPFDTITNLISDSTFPTSNLYFMQVYKIEYWLKAHENSEVDVIVEMVKAMKEKFDKYWHEYSEILAMAAVCDPRFKLSLLEYCFTNLDESTSQRKVEKVHEKMKLLFKAYSKPADQSSPPARENVHKSVAAVLGKGVINHDEFRNFHKKNVSASGKSALDSYLEESLVDMNMFPELDVLDFWKKNSDRFGELSKMACDLLSIPITTVASESSFSIGSRVLNKYRSCLLPKNVQALICARNWLRGFKAYDDNELEANESDEHLPSESFASTT